MNIDIYNKLILERKPDIEVLMRAAHPEPDDPEYVRLKAMQRRRRTDKRWGDTAETHKAKVFQEVDEVLRNTDGSGDYDGDVYLSGAGLRSLLFMKGLRRVYGVVDCSNNKLTSLEGAPVECKEFNCSGNQLTNLIGAPEKCTTEFDCSKNKLTSLEGGPTTCPVYKCSDNQLTNLKGALDICVSFYCQNNQLTTLEGAPKEFSRNFDCSNNLLTNLKGSPILWGRIFNCSYNKLTSLEGASIVCDTIYCDNNPVSEERLIRDHEERIRNMKQSQQEDSKQAIRAVKIKKKRAEIREIGYVYLDGSIGVEDSVDISGLGLKSITEIAHFAYVDGDFDCSNNELENLDGAPRECGVFDCSNNRLKSLIGAPDERLYIRCEGNARNSDIMFDELTSYNINRMREEDE